GLGGPGHVNPPASRPNGREVRKKLPVLRLAAVADHVHVPPALEKTQELADDERLGEPRKRGHDEGYAAPHGISSSRCANSPTWRFTLKSRIPRARAACPIVCRRRGSRASRRMRSAIASGSQIGTMKPSIPS